jgi:hypothetical protein
MIGPVLPMRPTPATTLVRYEVDRLDHIVFVSDEWDDVAAHANSSHLHSAGILGQPLWRYISDVGTSEIYRHILGRVRDGQPLEVTLRCDTPDLRRTIRLSLTADPDGTVAFHSRVVTAETRPHQAMLDARTPRSDELLHVCGWCKKFRVQGRWMEVEEAVSLLGLFDAATCPRMSHGICESCLVKMTA